MRARRVASPIVGLDLSLTGPAACWIPSGWEIGDWSALKVEAWKPALPKSPDNLDELYFRLAWITHRVRDFVTAKSKERPAYVAVEGYAFAAHSSSVTKLAELGGAVRVALWEAGFLAHPVTASAARKFLLGKLPKKDAKVATHLALWGAGAPKEWSGDVLDAFACANYALSDQGVPAMTLV